MSKALYTLKEKKQFVENIKKICKDNNISIPYIAKCSSLDKSAFYYWFSGKVTPNMPKILNVSKALLTLNIQIDTIFEGIRITKIGKNILKLYAKENIDTTKLSEDLDVTEKNIYYIIIGLRLPSTQFSIKLVQYLINKNIPIEEVFDDISISLLGITILKICRQEHLDIKELAQLLSTKSTNIYSWIYGVSKPSLKALINIIKVFRTSNISFEEIFSNLNISNIGKIILEQSAIKDTSLEELADYLNTDTKKIEEWIFGTSNPSNSDLVSIANFFNISTKELSTDIYIFLKEKLTVLCKDKQFLKKFKDSCSVTNRTVYNWVNENRNPTLQTLVPLIKAFIELDVPINDIFTGTCISSIGKIILEQSAIKDTDLKELADYLGTTSQTVNNWIYGRTVPSKLMLLSIATYFNIPIQTVDDTFSNVEMLEILQEAISVCESKITLNALSKICGISNQMINNLIHDKCHPLQSTINYVKENISNYSN